MTAASPGARARSTSASRPPTARQAEVLRLVAASVRERGFAPTLRELCEATGISSTNGITDHVKGLARRGLLTQTRMLSRSLVLTERGRAFIEAQSAPAEATTEGETGWHSERLGGA